MHHILTEIFITFWFLRYTVPKIVIKKQPYHSLWFKNGNTWFVEIIDLEKHFQVNFLRIFSDPFFPIFFRFFLYHFFQSFSSIFLDPFFPNFFPTHIFQVFFRFFRTHFFPIFANFFGSIFFQLCLYFFGLIFSNFFFTNPDFLKIYLIF